MEKILTCTQCKKEFRVSGPLSTAKYVPQSVTCPHCEEPNEVMWPMDTTFTTIPKRRQPYLCRRNSSAIRTVKAEGTMVRQ